MTRAPANLLAARRLLIDHLGPDARPPAGVTILDPLGDPVWEIGIVGDADHRGGYHCGSDRLDPSRDYSVVESSRDSAGLTLDAAALDVGRFKVRTALGVFDLPHYSRWLVAQCVANTPDTRHLREVIYSPDGRTVRRWDRLGRRSTGDSSHLGHTHESCFRDAIKAGADVTAVKRRYLTTIGVIQEDDMFEPSDRDRLRRVETALTRLDGREPIGQAYLRLAEGIDHADGARPVSHPTMRSLAAQLTAMQAALLGAVQGVDTEAILARIDAVAAAEVERDQAAAQRDAQAAAERAQILELLHRWQSGDLTAQQVVDELARRMTAASAPAAPA